MRRRGKSERRKPISGWTSSPLPGGEGEVACARIDAMTAEKKAGKGRVVPEATSSGIPIEPYYGEPAPGEFPFTRGISAEGYRNRFWTMRQYAGFGSARESNRRYRYLLEQGQTGLSVAFDLPTQMGYDSDDPLARGEVGKAGVSIATIDDMRLLTDGIPLGEV